MLGRAGSLPELSPDAGMTCRAAKTRDQACGFLLDDFFQMRGRPGDSAQTS